MYPVIRTDYFEISSYTLLQFVAIIVTAFLLRHELNRNHYPQRFWLALTAVFIAAMFVGGKLYYILEVWNEFKANPREIIFSVHGSRWYGGLILGCILSALLFKVRNLPVLITFDVIAPVIPLGQAIGRIGCFLAGCCHGKPSQVKWSVSFPFGQYPAYVTVHPTQIYEMSIYICIFILLWRLRKKNMQSGLKFALYLVLAGLGRFIIEFYRLNSQVMLQLTFPQVIAMLSVCTGTIIILKSYVLKTGRTRYKRS